MFKFRAKVDSIFLRMHDAEMPFVAGVVRFSQPKISRTLVKWINVLYDGWIYSLLLIFLLIRKDWRLLVTGALAVGICFCVYYLIKPAMARVRPCDYASTLAIPSRYLDKYSFPSGHFMTLTALSITLSWHHPQIIPPLLLAGGLLCWARLATAHHYPSDLIGGMAIGLAVAIPTACLLL